MIKSFLARARNITLTDCAAVFALLMPLWLILGPAVAERATIIIGVLFLIHCVWKRDWSWLRMRWVQICLVTWLYLFISAYFALADQHIAFARAATWIRFVILTAAIVFWISRCAWWPKYSGWFIAFVVAVVAGDTLIQYMSGYSLTGHAKPDYAGRLNGPMKRLVVGIFLAHIFWPGLAQIVLWARQQTAFAKRILLPLGFIGFTTLIILLSGERMAFLLTGLSLGIFFVFAKGLRKQLFICGLSLMLLGVAMVATQPSIRARVIDGTNMIQNIDETGYGIIFGNAIHAWTLSPLTGVGPKNFIALCKQKGKAVGYKDVFPQSPEFFECARHPHNPYLEWLADTGLIGFSLFVVLIFVWSREAIVTVWRNRFAASPVYLHQLTLACGLIPFFWPLQGNMSIFTNWNAILFWWTIGVILSGLKPVRQSAH